MIEYINDLMFSTSDFTESYDYLVNTVNCVGVMGAGVALTFKNHFPDMFQWYKLLCEQREFRPGHIRVWNNKVICMATKDHWKYPSEMEWVYKGLINMRNFIESTGRYGMRVALPLPGAGKGKLNRSDVVNLINTTLSKFDESVTYDVYVGPPITL